MGLSVSPGWFRRDRHRAVDAWEGRSLPSPEECGGRHLPHRLLAVARPGRARGAGRVPVLFVATIMLCRSRSGSGTFPLCRELMALTTCLVTRGASQPAQGDRRRARPVGRRSTSAPSAASPPPAACTSTPATTTPSTALTLPTPPTVTTSLTPATSGNRRPLLDRDCDTDRSPQHLHRSATTNSVK
jgi:hypothetical protein